jgi:hypothetical protein
MEMKTKMSENFYDREETEMRKLKIYAFDKLISSWRSIRK